ncbi:MAG: ferrous iron transport protein A [Desulfohalobiaceae bacterium]
MSATPLNHFPPGSKVKIADFHAGGAARGKLLAMGLTPGTEILLTSSGQGPCRMKVRDSELVLGHGLASKILANSVE